MGELVSVASQAPVTTCLIIAATLAADSFLRSLQTSLEHFLFLKPSDKTCSSRYVVIKNDWRHRILFSVGYRCI